MKNKNTEIVNLLKAEIDWCKDNIDDEATGYNQNINRKDFKEGFIQGLEQAIRLIKKVIEMKE